MAAFAALALAAPGSALADFTVNSTADSGAGSLREAITNANLNPGPDTITITATGTIELESVLDFIGG